MPTLDETMREALRRHTPSRDAGEVFDHLVDRRRRRIVARKLGTIGLVIAVLGGTAGAFALLGHAFGTNPAPLGAPTADNGALVVSLQNEDGFSLYVLPAAKQDLAPAASGVAAGRDDMRHLTGTGAERDVHPAVSPDGTTVAYVRRASSDDPGALWTIGMDGSGAHQIVAPSVAVEDPAWSPDGTWIAFTGVVTDVRALYLVRPDGSDLHVLPFTPQSTVASPSWSPDGTSIVVSASPVFGDGLSDLWVMGSDGSNLRNLTSTTDFGESDPAWSPDGAWIAVTTSDGIERIPAGGGSSEVLVPASGVDSDRPPAQPAWSPDGRYLAFAFGPTAPLPPVVYVLPVGGATAFPLAQGWSFAWQTIPANGVTNTPVATPQENLGLGYDVCRVTSMPISTSTGGGGAYVFSKKSDAGCPERADGFVGVDVDNDGGVDATYGPLEDCFLRCEAFAAPDVNADGVSEVAVSTEGADGYGVWLFAITSNGPSIDPIHVEDPQRAGVMPNGLEFAWVDVATHFAGARCGTLESGKPALIIDAGEKQGASADVRSASLVLNGTDATIVDNVHAAIPISDAPIPGHELCGTPLFNSAESFPYGGDPSQESLLCDQQSARGDLDGDGTADTVTIGTIRGANAQCPEDGQRDLVIDLGSDGSIDLERDPPDCSVWCVPFAVVDLNADHTAEVLIDEGHTAPPASAVVGVYELRSAELQPILFPNDTNQFQIVTSWQGYFGAYCGAADHSLILWEGRTDDGGSLRSVIERTYTVDVVSLRFLQIDKMIKAPAAQLPPSGADGRICGADALAIG